jgi:hypothetical protein
MKYYPFVLCARSVKPLINRGDIVVHPFAPILPVNVNVIAFDVNMLALFAVLRFPTTVSSV